MVMAQSTIYNGSELPLDHISNIRKSDKTVKKLTKPAYGLDSPLGAVSSAIFAPLYIYASKKGKGDAWDKLLDKVPEETYSRPVLDAGCGRGLVLLKHAQRKARKGFTAPAIGIDIFSTADQTGNGPEATYANAEALNVLDNVKLHTLSFASTLPFQDGAFGLVTSSLAIHNVSTTEQRIAVAELARVTEVGGMIIILDLMGYVAKYAKTLREVCGWTEVETSFGGVEVMFGAWPCEVLIARKTS